MVCLTRTQSMLQGGPKKLTECLLAQDWAEGHFRIGPAEKGTGSTLSAGKVWPSAVLERMRHPQKAGFLLLTALIILTRKRVGHFQLQYSLVSWQIRQRKKVTAATVGAPHVFSTVAQSHMLFPQAFLTQSPRSHHVSL